MTGKKRFKTVKQSNGQYAVQDTKTGRNEMENFATRSECNGWVDLYEANPHLVTGHVSN